MSRPQNVYILEQSLKLQTEKSKLITSVVQMNKLNYNCFSDSQRYFLLCKKWPELISTLPEEIRSNLHFLMRHYWVIYDLR